MSRLNPHANPFSALNGLNGRHTPSGSVDSTSSLITPATFVPNHSNNAPRPINEIDLTKPRPAPITIDNAWRTPVHRVEPSPTAPVYGRSWNSTFPKPSGKSSNSSSPTIGASAFANGGVASPTRTVTHPVRPRPVFEPFGEDDALPNEAVDVGCLATTTPSNTSCTVNALASRFSSMSTLGDFDPNVFRDDDDEVEQSRNVYIPNPPADATEAQLQKFGHHYGRVVSVKVQHSGPVTHDLMGQFPHQVGGEERSYAFVMFDSHTAAMKFIQGLAQNNIQAQLGRETPHLKQKALEDPHSSNCYMADLPLDFTREEMDRLVYPASIAAMRFLVDKDGNRRGTAMVRMQSRSQADDVIQRLNGNITLRGCSKPVQVRIADSENQKQYKQIVNRHRSSPSGSFDYDGSGAGTPITPFFGSFSGLNGFHGHRGFGGSDGLALGGHSSSSSGASHRSASFGSDISGQSMECLARQVQYRQDAILQQQQNMVREHKLNRPLANGSVLDAPSATNTRPSPPSSSKTLFTSLENLAPRRVPTGYGTPPGAPPPSAASTNSSPSPHTFAEALRLRHSTTRPQFTL